MCVHIWLHECVYVCVFVCVYLHGCIYSCVFVYVYTYVYLCVYRCIPTPCRYMWRSEADAGLQLKKCLSSVASLQVLTDPGGPPLSRLSGHQAPRTHLSLSFLPQALGLWVCTMPGFFRGSGDPTESTLPTKPSPWPHSHDSQQLWPWTLSPMKARTSSFILRISRTQYGP